MDIIYILAIIIDPFQERDGLHKRLNSRFHGLDSYSLPIRIPHFLYPSVIPRF